MPNKSLTPKGSLIDITSSRPALTRTAPRLRRDTGGLSFEDLSLIHI